MKICDYLYDRHIFLDAALADKPSLLRFIAEAACENHVVKDADRLYDGLLSREKTLSTGVGDGIGFPHTISGEAAQAAIFMVRLATPIEFDALDKKPVDIILALIIPEHQTRLHVRLLAAVSRLCKDRNFIAALRSIRDRESLCPAIRRIEARIPFH